MGITQPGYVNVAIEMAIEIVSFPSENGDFPVRYIKLPEGTSRWRTNFLDVHAVFYPPKKRTGWSGLALSAYVCFQRQDAVVIFEGIVFL